MAKTIIKHDCTEELHTFDLRATPARIAVLRLLETTDIPVDVTMIIGYLQKHGIKIDPATAFRIINMFTQNGLTQQLTLNEGKFRYELSSKADHHHLICENCGKIQDISDCAIPELEHDIKKKKGFLVKRHALEFFGLCADCQNS